MGLSLITAAAALAAAVAAIVSAFIAHQSVKNGRVDLRLVGWYRESTSKVMPPDEAPGEVDSGGVRTVKVEDMIGRSTEAVGLVIANRGGLDVELRSGQVECVAQSPIRA